MWQRKVKGRDGETNNEGPRPEKMAALSLELLRQHNAFFDQLVDMIPAALYLTERTEEEEEELSK